MFREVFGRYPRRISLKMEMALRSNPRCGRDVGTRSARNPPGGILSKSTVFLENHMTYKIFDVHFTVNTRSFKMRKKNLTREKVLIQKYENWPFCYLHNFFTYTQWYSTNARKIFDSIDEIIISLFLKIKTAAANSAQSVISFASLPCIISYIHCMYIVHLYMCTFVHTVRTYIST